MNEEYRRWVRHIAESDEPLEIAGPGSDPEHCDVIVCRLVTGPLLMPDNIVGTCSKCFRMVQFRPHAPKKPQRVCDECVIPMLEAQRRSGEGSKFVITENTARDLAEFAKRKKMQ